MCFYHHHHRLAAINAMSERDSLTRESSHNRIKLYIAISNHHHRHQNQPHHHHHLHHLICHSTIISIHNRGWFLMGTFLSAIFLSAIHDTATAFDVNKQERWHRIVEISIRWMRGSGTRKWSWRCPRINATKSQSDQLAMTKQLSWSSQAFAAQQKDASWWSQELQTVDCDFQRQYYYIIDLFRRLLTITLNARTHTDGWGRAETGQTPMWHIFQWNRIIHLESFDSLLTGDGWNSIKELSRRNVFFSTGNTESAAI